MEPYIRWRYADDSNLYGKKCTMKSYKERFKDASNIYEAGLQRVANTPEPKKQKFPVGSRVYIQKDLGSYMSHFTSGCNATIEYTYAHAYGGNNIDSYSLIIDGKGSSAWYEEHHLTLIKETK